MADWSKLTGRGNVEDRRALGPTAIGGGVGIVGLVAYLFMSFLGGGQVDMNEVLNQLQNVQVGQSEQYDPADFAGADAYETFASTIVGSSDEMWEKMFAQAGASYTPPTLVLFRGSTTSSCGGASAAVGPHYCPEDQTIYLDETFFEELTTRLGARGGDVAEAYVIAHEAGHHAQHELGIMDSLDRTEQSNSIQIELQADCFAGLWAYSIKDLGVFEPGEIEEAIDAARAVGDDRIQQETTGRIHPEQWTHGSSAQRVAAFNKGFTGGTLASCSF